MKALALFEQALALDPDYAMAHAGLASTYLLMASTAMLRPLQVDEAMPMARRAAERALALDEGLAEAWAALGRVKMEYDWDWDGAEADLAHAVALNASSVEALATFGQFLSAMGRHDEAIEAMEQARRLDPRSVETLQHLGIVYWMAGQAERALDAVNDSLKIAPEFSPRALRAHDDSRPARPPRRGDGRASYHAARTDRRRGACRARRRARCAARAGRRRCMCGSPCSSAPIAGRAPPCNGWPPANRNGRSTPSITASRHAPPTFALRHRTRISGRSTATRASSESCRRSGSTGRPAPSRPRWNAMQRPWLEVSPCRPRRSASCPSPRDSSCDSAT